MRLVADYENNLELNSDELIDIIDALLEKFVKTDEDIKRAEKLLNKKDFYYLLRIEDVREEV